jgi:hypothetical protein
MNSQNIEFLKRVMEISTKTALPVDKVAEVFTAIYDMEEAERIQEDEKESVLKTIAAADGKDLTAGDIAAQAKVRKIPSVMNFIRNNMKKQIEHQPKT